MNEFCLAGRMIGVEHAPYIVAELSGNHNQSIERALKLVELAAKSQVDAIKLQTYTADTMTLDIDEGEFFIGDDSELWKGSSLYQLYTKAHTPWDWHEQIFRRCRELGIVGFSSPFDETAVDFLESLNVPAYKIASFENTDLPLIRKVAATGKPLVISTGMASLAELDETVKTARNAGCRNLVLLKCTTSYPADPKDSNLKTIPHLKDAFGVQVGLSDHTLGIGAAVASVGLGATFIEKHFTTSRAEGGVDSAFSMEPDEMAQLVIECRRAWQSLGQVHYGQTEVEKSTAQYRRSLYVTQDMKAGDTLSPENLRVIRPGLGLPPKFYDVMLGKQVKCDVRRGTALNWDML